jgi:hypothetical protein
MKLYTVTELKRNIQLLLSVFKNVKEHGGGARHMRYGMERDHTHSYKLCENIVYKSTVTSKVTMLNSEFMSNKFNAY